MCVCVYVLVAFVRVCRQSKKKYPKTLLFAWYCRLEFTEALDILAMYSSEGEKVGFSESISTSAARGAVEKWLLQVQDIMTVSLRDVIEQARDVSVCVCVCTCVPACVCLKHFQ